MKKVLFVATVVKKHIMVFHIPYLEWFKKNGYEVHVAARNDYTDLEECQIPFCDKFIDLPFERSPLKKDNFNVYKELKQIIDENDYEIIHCHTPIGGAVARLAARKSREKGTKVIYTAHGFHFFKGAPFVNWLVYYPVEKWLARYTDTLITINQEDYDLATHKKFKAENTVLVNGVGISLERFKPQTENIKRILRKKYGYKSTDFILIFVGELSYRKHQDLLISVADKLKDRIPNLKILLVGNGKLENEYRERINSLGVQNFVDLLGFRTDVDNLMNLADIAVSTSRQEGLPVNVLEAMATGLPLVVTNCRGNRDLVEDSQNGYVIELSDTDGFANSIEKLYNSKILRKYYSEKNLENIQEFSLESILLQMKDVYHL